jgi:hypothetical protein
MVGSGQSLFGKIPLLRIPSIQCFQEIKPGAILIKVSFPIGNCAIDHRYDNLKCCNSSKNSVDNWLMRIYFASDFSIFIGFGMAWNVTEKGSCPDVLG